MQNSYFDNLLAFAKYDDAPMPAQPVPTPTRLGTNSLKAINKYIEDNRDSYANDLIDSGQSGFYDTIGDLATGVRHLTTDNKDPNRFERSMRKAAEINREEIDPQRLSEMQQWGFGKDDDITLSNTGMQLANVAGSFIPSMVPGGALAKAAQVGTKVVGLGSKAQKLAEAGGYAVSGAPLIGGSAANEVSETLRNMPSEQLRALAAKQGMLPEDYIYYSEQLAAKYGAGVGATSMGIAGPLMGKLALGLGTKSALPRIATGATVEGTQEAFEEGGQARVVNPLVGRDNWQDVAERAGEGFVLGSGAGGVAGGTGSIANKLLPDTGALSNAVNKNIVANEIKPSSEDHTLSSEVKPLADATSATDLMSAPVDLAWAKYDSIPQQRASIKPFGINKTVTSLENDPRWSQTDTGAWTDGINVLNVDANQKSKRTLEAKPHSSEALSSQAKLEISPESQSISTNILQRNKEVDNILKTRGLENPLNQIIASKIEAMNQDGLNPEEYHALLSGFADSFNAGVLAAENNEVSNTRSNADPYYFSGASLIGKDNIAKNDKPVQLEYPEHGLANQPDASPIQFPDNPQDKVRVEQIPRSHFKSPVEKVNSNHDAAQLVKAAIGNDATESMLAVITGENGEVLNVIRHTEGLKASSTVAAGDLVSAIVNTPGAKTVRWAHSHPSGKTSSSNADEKITKRLNKLLEGTGITPAGHVIVVPHQEKYYDLDSGKEETLLPDKAEAKHPMALTKRVIVRRDMDNPVVINSPATGRMAAAKIPGESGLVLLDTRHQVIGNLPLTQDEMLALKNGDKPALNEIFKAIDRTNTSAVIIKGDSKLGAANVARFLNAHGDVRVLDYINQDGQSNAEGDERIIKAHGKYFQKVPASTTGQTVQALQKELNNLRNVNIVDSDEDPTVSGHYDPNSNVITLIANKIKPGKARKALLHEGTHAVLKNTPIYREALAELNKPAVRRSKAYKNALGSVDAAGTPEAQQQEEILAYMIQHTPKAGVVTRLINKIRKFLREHFGLTKVTIAEVREAVEAYLEGLKAKSSSEDGTQDSQVKDVAGRFDEVINSGSAITNFLKNKKEDWRPTLLGTLTLRQLADVGKQYLPQLQDYVDLNTKMQTERNASSEEYNTLAETWRKWSARNRKESEALASLMHDSTLAGIDPSQSNSNPALKRRYDKLSPEAQQLFQNIRDSYILQNRRMADALQERIESSELNHKQKEVLKLEIRNQFEQAKSEGVYFPLSRFGQYWLAAKDKSGERLFSMFESHAELVLAEKKLKSQGYSGITTGRQLDKARLGDADESLMVDLNDVLQRNGIDPNSPLMDDVYQVFLRTMPSVSMRKSFIHRQGTQGFSPDALRSYASHSTHNASQTARLRYSGQMKSLLDEMKEDSGSVKSTALINEMQKRHEWVMNPTNSKIAQKTSAIGFAWFLGANPASAMVNLTQNALVTMPVLASKHGAVKSFTQMNKVLGEFLKAKGNFNSGLSGNRLRAFKAMQASGAIDVTQAHNLAGLSETDTMNDYSPKMHKAMKGISYLFHKAEVLNRAVSGMAAYDLARNKGMSHNDAIRYAEEVIWESHFDYGNANRARFMQGDFAKVLLMFRQYSQNVTYYLMRNFYQTFKGEDKQTRLEARKKLTGTLGVSAIMSGTFGLPMVSTLAATANAAASAFGDDDEPYDFNTELRAFLTDYLGKNGASYVLDGAVNQLTGGAVSDRVKLNDLWLRAPSRDMEGRDSYHYYLEQIAGPMGSIPLNAMRGMQLINEGHLQRGIEAMLPVALKNAAKSFRYADEGVNTLRGDALVNDISAYENIIQAAGFTPARVSEQYKINNSVKNYEQHILTRRSRLLAAFAMARASGESTKNILNDMRQFSKKYLGLRINQQTLRKSMQSRARYSRTSQHGINVNKKLGDYLSKYD